MKPNLYPFWNFLLQQRWPILGVGLQRWALRQLADQASASLTTVPMLVQVVLRTRAPRQAKRFVEQLHSLAQQGSELARETLCRLYLDHAHPLARKVVQEFRYQPAAVRDQAVLLFLTGRYDEYEGLDFDHTYLRSAYEHGSPTLRHQIAAMARSAGRLEWLEIATGGQRGQRLGLMTETEWQAALTLLQRQHRWEELWQLAQRAPATWSIPLLSALVPAFEAKQWQPSTAAEVAFFPELVRQAQACLQQPPPWGRLPIHCRATRGVDFSPQTMVMAPGGDWVAIGGAGGHSPVALWHLPECRPRFMPSIKGEVYLLAFDPTGTYLAGASADHSITLWELATGNARSYWTGQTQPIRSLWFETNSQILVAFCRDSSAITFPIHSRNPHAHWLQAAEKPSRRGEFLTISADGRFQVTFSRARRVLLVWQTGQEHPRCSVGGVPLASLAAISPNGQYLAFPIAHHGREYLQLVETSEGRLVRQLSVGDDTVRQIGFSHDGQLLWSGSQAGIIRCWQVPSGVAWQTLEDPMFFQCLALSPQRDWLVTADEVGGLRFWTADLLFRSPPSESAQRERPWVESLLQRHDLMPAERHWLEFWLSLHRWQRRFDIQLAEPIALANTPGSFDIEIEVVPLAQETEISATPRPAPLEVKFY